jgi:hypothetical protein
MLATNTYDTATVARESRRALELLEESNSYVRTSVIR